MNARELISELAFDPKRVGESKAKAPQACLISITAAKSLPQETGRAKSSRYIVLSKAKRVCRLDQNTVTMALRSFRFAILISRRLLYLILINSNIALASYKC